VYTAQCKENTLPKSSEVEIKFRVADVRRLEQSLADAGFQLKTPPTHEVNSLYDRAGNPLRRQGVILRLRKYGERWRLTHKAKGTPGRHKKREEHETAVENGPELDAILRALGYAPSFVYEKFRAEWCDGKGEVVVDHTPIGDIAEIEGPARWIDRTARALGVGYSEYITKSYGELFLEWKKATGSPANNMTFRECGSRRPRFSRG
jgi:adenylate cyclase class 2